MKRKEWKKDFPEIDEIREDEDSLSYLIYLKEKISEERKKDIRNHFSVSAGVRFFEPDTLSGQIKTYSAEDWLPEIKWSAEEPMRSNFGKNWSCPEICKPKVNQATVNVSDTVITTSSPALQPKKPKPAKEFLSEAAEIVGGARKATHGGIISSFQAIARAWEFYLKNRKEPLAPIGPKDVAIMMERLKEIRFDFGSPVEDHIIDMCGYLGVFGEIAFGEGGNEDE